MKLTMRVHSLSLAAHTDTPMATLYRYDGVKSRKEQGWTDRMTIPAGSLKLGDLVAVTIERIDPEA